MNYYFFNCIDNTPIASAYAPEGTLLPNDLIPIIEKRKEVPFEFMLVKLTLTKDGLVRSSDLSGLKDIWLDYLPNSLAWPIFSEKLKNIVAENLNSNECIDWIPAKVNGAEEQRRYFIPSFTRMLDVLDSQKTIYIRGTDRIIRPCFSFEKIKNYNFFHKPAHFNLWKITSGLYVSEKMKKAIQKEKITGVTFEKTMVS